jgi:hypothetical protein
MCVVFWWCELETWRNSAFGYFDLDVLSRFCPAGIHWHVASYQAIHMPFIPALIDTLNTCTIVVKQSDHVEVRVSVGVIFKFKRLGRFHTTQFSFHDCEIEPWTNSLFVRRNIIQSSSSHKDKAPGSCSDVASSGRSQWNPSWWGS